MRTLFFFIAALATTALAVPTGPRSTCAVHCTDSETFRYATGKSYVYDYSVTTSTALLETFDDDTQMRITAQAYIDVTSPCDYVLRLTDVNLEGSSHTGEFSEAIMRYPLRFSFQDGIVESVCSEESEPTWVLNFKRGVLSTFQNSMNHLHLEVAKETDISGVCTTHYDVSSEGDVITTIKEKDLTSCKRNVDLKTYIGSTNYASDSPIQSLPIFNSTSKCAQTISEGLMQKVECVETHKFRPFSTEEGGAVTIVRNTMNLKSQVDATPVPGDMHFISKSVVFNDDSCTMTETDSGIQQILDNLKTSSLLEISPEVPTLFSKLVEALKNVDYPQLSEIYTKIQDPKSKKYFIDAMPLVGTSSSAGIVRDIIKNGEMTEIEADDWFTSLAFLKNPDSEMFTALAPLLEGTPSQKAMLGTSALINNYCKIHADCETDSGIIQIIRKIEAQLGSGCRAVNDMEKIKILVALKALGNAGRWVNANSILKRCYTEEENDMEIRVASLEAWRHTPCEYDRSNVQAAYEDETQDPEIRIAAYLAFMSCPTQNVIDLIKSRLTSEGVNQVGSFVWTHLSNMQESASPEKQWMREMIGEEMLQKKFSSEALRFSRNYESSFFMNELNTGATVESNIIFSGKSFLPRSAMLNLTLDLFGQSLNFFEVGGRIEGFESYVERFFGPNGYFPEKTVEGMVRNMRNQKTDYEPTTLEGFLDRVTDEPQGSYYLRIFGNELHYHNFQGIENIISSSGATNPLEFIMELARKGNVDYSKTHQLFDTHYTIPTISGLPLSLTAKGIATIGIQMKGNFKAKSLTNVNIEGLISPSAAVEVDGLMVLDAHVTRTGLKITSNLHTSTYIDGKIQINKGKLVDIAFNTPKEKVEVIKVQTKFFYLENDQEVEKGLDKQITDEGCTMGATGFALCGNYNYTPRRTTGPLFPLVGPFGAQVYFKKTDTHTGYALRYSQEQNEISFIFDTPESQNDHKVSINLAKTASTLAIDIHTPLKSAQGSGEYVWQRYNKNVKINVNVDGSEYGFVVGFVKNTELNQFEPSLILTAPSGELLNFKGFVQMEDQSNEINVELHTPVLDTVFNNKINYEDTFVSLKTDVDYSIKKGAPHTVHQTTMIKMEESEEVNTYSATVDFSHSTLSFLTFNLNYKTVISNNERHIESTGKLIREADTWEAHQLWLVTKENGLFKYKSELSLKCPQYNIDFFASERLSFNRNSLQGEIFSRMSPGKDVSVKLELSKNRDVELLGKLTLEAPDANASIEAHYNKIAARQHKVQIITKVMDETFLLEGTLKNTSTRGKVNAVFEGICKCSSYDVKSTLNIDADMTKGVVGMKTIINGKEYSAKLEGTPTAVLVDINIIRHIYLNAYTTSSAQSNKVLIHAEWDKEVDPTKSFIVDAELTTKSMLFSLKVLDYEYLLSSKLLNNGAELVAQWAPNKKITCNLEYRVGETTSLSATIETPFQGWEKQDAMFTASLKDYKLNSRFAVTWKNSEQISLTVETLVEPGTFTNALKANIVFTSSFDKFERISFLLDHTMTDLNVNSKVEGKWDAKELNGKFHLQPNDNGIEGQLSFVSSFTEDLLVTLKHALQGDSLSSIIEAKYGSDFVTITLKGHVELDNVQNVALVFKVTSSANTPEISTNINFSNDGSLLKLIVDGVMGDQKVMLNVNGNLLRADTTKLTGDLRFITPFTYPLTASISHTADSQSFTSEFEMSRIWSTYGNLKLLVEGQMISSSNKKLSAILSTPANKASISFIHSIADKKMTSSIDALLNGERIHVAVQGTVDTDSSLADLEAEMTSTFNELDDIKVTVKSEKKGTTRTSTAIFMKGTDSVNVDHIITISDRFNWENTFKINGNYMLMNKQAHNGNMFSHDLQYNWDTEEVQVTLNFEQKVSGPIKEIIALLSLATPWTENMKLDFHHKYGNSENNPVIILEYAPGQKIELSHTVKIQDAFIYVEASLITPFWQNLGYKFNVDNSPKSAITLVLLRGSNKTTIHTGGKWQKGKLEGNLEIDSTYLSLPVSVEVACNIISEEKFAQLIVNYDKRYEVKGSVSGNIKHAKWMLKVEVPFELIKNIEFTGEYNVTSMPLLGKLSLDLDSMNYSIDGQWNSNEFVINVNADGKKGSLSSNWSYSHTKSNILITFESPFSVADHLTLYVMYDFEHENKVNIKVSKGSSEIDLIGKLDDATLLFDGTTPFSGWETLKASFFLSDSAINAYVSRNELKIEVTGTLHAKLTKGRINLTITTPYAKYETISVDLVYSLKDRVKTVEFKSTFGTQEIMLKGIIDVTVGLAPKMKLDITTPFDVVKKVGGSIQWNFKDSTKTALAKAYRNDREYQWELLATVENIFKSKVEAKIATPLTGWTNINLKGEFDFTAMPYNVAFTYEKEGIMQAFAGRFSLENDSLSAELTTPITGWEKIMLNGVFSFENDHLIFNTNIMNNSDKYNVTGDFLFNTQKPKFNITLETPISYASKIEFAFDTNLVDATKLFFVSLKIDDAIYSVELNWEFHMKVGFVNLKLQSPVTGFSTFDIIAKFDFTDDIKTAEVDLKKEGQNHHISLTARVNDNNLFMEMHTPFEQFKKINFSGDYTRVDNEHVLQASFIRNNLKYNLAVNVLPNDHLATLKLETPIEFLKNIEANGKYSLLDHGIEASLHFKNSNQIFDFSTRGIFTPLESDLVISVQTPVTGWNKMVIDSHYDVKSEIKSASLLVQKDSFVKKVSIEGSYTLTSASFKIETPVEGFKTIGAEYNLNLNERNHQMDALVKLYLNSKEWVFSAQGQYQADRIFIKFQTPFEGFNTISAEGNINFDSKVGQGDIQFGTYNFHINVSYAPANYLVEILTPFASFKTFSIGAVYNWTESRKDATLNITYNEKSYVLKGTLTMSSRKSEILFQVTTPFQGVDNLTIHAKYDIDNKDELVSVKITTNTKTYGFMVGGFIEDKNAQLDWEFLTPFSGWSQAKFTSKIDLTSVDKNLIIMLERAGDVKEINISGKFIGDSLNFSLKTPFEFLKNLQMFGSLNRAKRSLEFRIQNDAADASLIANFKSVSLHLKTPFEVAEEITWEITKVNENTVKAEWKRNDNYVHVNVVKEGKKAAFNVQIKSEFQGWELLALTGRLDRETVRGYISGSINEDKIVVTGNGEFDTKGSFKVTIETPYDNYKSVEGNLDYNIRKGQFKLEAASSSSNFHFILERGRSGIITHHSIFPNAEKPTEISMSLGKYSGKVTITSRFPLLRDYYQEYNINLASVITADYIIKWNDLEVFKMDLNRDGPNQKLDLKMHFRRPGHHTTIEVQCDEFSSAHFLVKRDDKEFKIEAKGSGQLPTQGEVDINITNTFREVPRNIKVHVVLNVASSADRKQIKIEVSPSRSRLYIFDLNYSVNRSDYKTGDFTWAITTPDKSYALWKNISGSWNVEDQNNVNIGCTIGGIDYTVDGKFTLRESTLVLVPKRSGAEKIFLQWIFDREGPSRDYFIKFGQETKYSMLKLKGSIIDYAHVDVEAGFKLGACMDDEFLFTTNWNKDSSGTVSGGGNFSYGTYHGDHTVSFRRDASTRSATFEASGTSNIPDYTKVSVSGNYNFNNKAVVHVVVNANDRESKIDVNFENINLTHSLNTANINIPILGSYGQIEMTFSHDFRRNAGKSIAAVAKFADREAYVKANWKRSDNFDTLEGTIDIKSIFVGEIHITSNFDLTNMNDAHAEATYSRTPPSGVAKIGSLKWTRKRTPNHFETELIIDTPLEFLRHGRIHINADFSDIFHLTAAAERNDRLLTLELDVKEQSIKGKITTPYQNFELIEGLLTYDLGGKNKTVQLVYERGTRKVNLDIKLNVKAKKEGEFELTLTTPFEIVNNLHIVGKWSRKKAEINYQRNDVVINFSGKADIKADKSSFDLSFDPPSGQTLRVAGSYDVKPFLEGTGTEKIKLASLELEFDGNTLSFNVNGYRNDDRVFIEIDGQTSFALVKTFHLKLDSELNTQRRDGHFELHVNDFEFKMHNHYERRGDGYYFRSQVESTLTPLPALIFGIGHEGEEHIVTLGYGENKEITFSIKAKDDFESGFSGYIDIPNFGYDGVKYEVEYEFENENELHIDVELELGSEGKVEADFVYNSDGVQARFNSLRSGEHRMRFRRAISSNAFYIETGIDDYSMKLRGGFNDGDTKRGFMLEGEVFGRKIMIDALLQSEGLQYTEGKLIITTPFQGWETLGGLFTWAYSNMNIIARAEVNLPSYSTPKITAEVNLNLNNKIEGYVTINMAGEEFSFKSKLSGSVSEGFNGKIEIVTPFHTISHVEISGNFKADRNTLNADLKIEAPLATHEVKASWNFSLDVQKAQVMLQSSRLSQVYNININVEKTGTLARKADLDVNGNKVHAEWNLDGHTFLINIDTEIMGIPRRFSAQANYASLDNLDGTLLANLGGKSHKVHGTLNILPNNIKGIFELESGLINGQRAIKFDILMPDTTYKKVSCDLTFVSEQIHTMYFEYDLTNGVILNFKINTPLFPKVSCIFTLTPASASFSLETPRGTHKLAAGWRVTRKMPVDYVGNLELSSPLLPVDYTFGIMFGGNQEKRTLKAELTAGSVKHVIEGMTSMTGNGGGFSFNIETPIKNINKASLEAQLEFGSKVVLHISGLFGSKINTFDVSYDKASRMFSAVMESPFLPTGSVKVEAQIAGEINKNMTVKMDFNDNEKSISGLLSVKVISPQNIDMDLKITTPFKGYKKMNFTAQYKKTDDIVVVFSLDKPAKFTAELRLGNLEDIIKADLMVETSLKSFETLEGRLYIPLNTFEPRVSANLKIDNHYYGGNLGLRTKAPYELSCGLQVPNLIDNKFHIRTDSSFFSFLA